MSAWTRGIKAKKLGTFPSPASSSSSSSSASPSASSSRKKKKARGSDKGGHRVTLLGLDGSGKTTILYSLKLQCEVATVQTVGFNVETIESPAGDLTVWDIGGAEKIRPLWRHYISEDPPAIIVFVVDVSDESRFAEASAALQSVLSHEASAVHKLLLLLNKVDLAVAAGRDESTVVETAKAALGWDAVVAAHPRPCASVVRRREAEEETTFAALIGLARQA